MTRYRQRSDTLKCLNPPITFENTTYGVTVVGGQEVNMATISENMTDVVTPAFRRQSAIGKIFCNDMTQNKSNTVYPSYYVNARRLFSGTYRTIDGVVTVNTIPFLNVPAIPSASQSDIDGAITDAHASIKATEMDLNVMVAELNETLRLLAGIGYRFYKIYRLVKEKEYRLLYRKAKSTSLEDFRKLWLEYRYGIRPLYYDLRGVYKYLNRGELAPRRTARGSRTTQVSKSAVTTGYIYTYPNSVDTNGMIVITYYKRWTEQNTSVRAGALYTADFRSELSKQLSLLGVDRPLSSLWDLLPYSFIADWFLGIGSFIASWEPHPGFNILTSWSTVEREAKSIIEIIGVNAYAPTSGWVYFSGRPISVGTRYVVARSRTANPPLPVLPSLNVKLNAAKLLDLAALFLRLKVRS